MKGTSTKQADIDASAKAASEAARIKAEEQQRVRLEALERQRQLEDELLEKRKQVFVRSAAIIVHQGLKMRNKSLYKSAGYSLSYQ